MSEVTTVGLDIAKNVFQVHGIDAGGDVVIRRQLRRSQVPGFFKKLPACLVGIEACATSHHWAREITALGHEVRLMPARYVKAYVKRNKNDAADAEAICEAVTRPTMRFVEIKTPGQQSVLMLHRTRQMFVRQRTALGNAIRAHLAEFGIVAGVGRNGLDRLLTIIEAGGDLWERVQDMMDGRNSSKHRRAKHDFAFSGLIACGHCGCSIVGEIKKQRYIYYHCTGYKGKCNEPYVREEVLEEKFGALLGRLVFDDDVLDWVRDALHHSHADERREHEEATKRLRAEYDRLQNRIHAAYVDKLDGTIDAAFFEKMSDEWRAEQERCLREIERHQDADQSYLDDGVRLIELAQNAQRLFEKQDSREKRRLLNFLVSNSSWRGGELTVTLRQPFDLIAETTATEAKRKAAGDVSNDLSVNWLPGSDSNQRQGG